MKKSFKINEKSKGGSQSKKKKEYIQNVDKKNHVRKRVKFK